MKFRIKLIQNLIDNSKDYYVVEKQLGDYWTLLEDDSGEYALEWKTLEDAEKFINGLRKKTKTTIVKEISF